MLVLLLAEMLRRVSSAAWRTSRCVSRSASDARCSAWGADAELPMARRARAAAMRTFGCQSLSPRATLGAKASPRRPKAASWMQPKTRSFHVSPLLMNATAASPVFLLDRLPCINSPGSMSAMGPWPMEACSVLPENGELGGPDPLGVSSMVDDRWKVRRGPAKGVATAHGVEEVVGIVVVGGAKMLVPENWRSGAATDSTEEELRLLLGGFAGSAAASAAAAGGTTMEARSPSTFPKSRG
mmetsp:Transcript_102906/g.289399  ORF Transcript_102906/g.289399 Transcript_102906/m.289399 type:complete len:241 (+) Transcript_102906:1718-2440(+)